MYYNYKSLNFKTIMTESDKIKAQELLASMSEQDIKSLKSAFTEACDKLLSDETEKLANLKTQIESLIQEEKDIWAKEREMSYSAEKADLTTKRSGISAIIKIRKKQVLGQENIVQSLSNGGSISQFTDKYDIVQSNIADFRNIPSTNIGFDVENILTEPKPSYIPYINEELFKNKGYIFDAIRIGEDTYILAISGYSEKESNTAEFHTPYVLLTLDQLVLTQDYYFKKAKANAEFEAKRKTLFQEEYYNKLPIETRQRHLNQKGFYHSLPANIKKKLIQPEYEALSFEEREKIYKPYKRYGAERLISKLDDNQMWTSFHDMYQRFINKEAYPIDANKNPIKDRSKSQGKSFGNPETFQYWYWFRDLMDYKIKDIYLQREDLSENYKEAIETSFGDKNINDTLKEQFGVYVKRQNGDDIKPSEIEEIKDAIISVNSGFGDLKDRNNEVNLKISHSGNRLIFASKAVGVFISDMGTIGVSSKYGLIQFKLTLAHETGHYIDWLVGKNRNKRWASDDYEGLAGKIAFTFRDSMNKSKKEQTDYVNMTKECFARAFEQYYGMKILGENALLAHSYKELDKTTPIYNGDDFAPKEKFETVIMPLIEQFLEDNKNIFTVNVIEEKQSDMKNKDINLLIKKASDLGYAVHLYPKKQIISISGKNYSLKDGEKKLNEMLENTENIKNTNDMATMVREPHTEGAEPTAAQEAADHKETFEKIKEGEITTPEELGESVEADHEKEEEINHDELVAKAFKDKDIHELTNDRPQSESKQRFSTVKEIDRKEIITMPELFQGRQHAYSEESVNKIVSEGFDKTNDPIVVWWNPEKSKYVVLSGHSRWEASRRLYLGGDVSLATMPVKEFLGTLEEAINYAVLESNRASTQEGLVSDIKAVKRMLDEGFNRKEMLKYIKPESYIDKIISFTYLNPNGKFIEYLSQPSNISFPYLERNANWVGILRKMYPTKLTNEHESEIFDYIYKGGKKNLELKKDLFFNLIQSKLDKLDFVSTNPLNLANVVSTSALTKPGYEKIKEIESEIQQLQTEMLRKTDLISRAEREGKTELSDKFRGETRGLEQKIILLKNRVFDLKSQIGALEKTVVNDLFSMFSEPVKAKVESEVSTYNKEESDEAAQKLMSEAKENVDDCFISLLEFEGLKGKKTFTQKDVVNIYGIDFEILSVGSNGLNFTEQVAMLGTSSVNYTNIIKLFHSGNLRYDGYDNLNEQDKVKFDLMVSQVQLCALKEVNYNNVVNLGKASVSEIVKLKENIDHLNKNISQYESELNEIRAKEEAEIERIETQRAIDEAKRIDDDRIESERIENDRITAKTLTNTIQEYEDIISLYADLMKETKKKAEKQEYKDIVELYGEMLKELK